jgi:hypothetical protein
VGNVLHVITTELAVGEIKAMSATKQDWKAKLAAESAPALEMVTGEDGEPEILLEPYFDKDGLHFGPHRADPVNGLHFHAPRDTSASS